MKTVLKSNIYESTRVIKTYNEGLSNDRLKENSVEVKNNGICGTMAETQLNGACIYLRELSQEHPYEIEVEHDFPLFKLHIEIEGASQYHPDNDQGVPICIADHTYNLFYLPRVKGTLKYESKRRRSLEIMFTESYISKILSEKFGDAISRFESAVRNKEPFVMWENSAPITPDIYSLILDITSCSYPPEIKKAYLEAKVMELLIVVLSKQNGDKHAGQILPEADKKAIEKVVDYIRQHLSESLTITELSTIAGFNTSKLKSLFKQTQNTTIFQYITDQRMLKAAELIEEKGNSIARASYEVGYKNPQHFTVAFKKKYGYLPSLLLKH